MWFLGSPGPQPRDEQKPKLNSHRNARRKESGREGTGVTIPANDQVCPPRSAVLAKSTAPSGEGL